MDLVLTDFPDTRVFKAPQIVDHASILIVVPETLQREQHEPRRVWQYSEAEWEALKMAISNEDWRILLNFSVDEAIDWFYAKIDALMTRYIPLKEKRASKSTLPWLNDRCIGALAKKHSAEGKPDYAEECRRCNATLMEERNKYLDVLKTKLSNLGRGSKQWWNITKQMLRNRVQIKFFPPLKTIDGEWKIEPKDKANALAKHFESKFRMPPEGDEQFFHAAPSDTFPNRLIIRAREVSRELQ